MTEKKYYDKYKAEGRCVNCGGPIDSSYIQCEKCRIKNRGHYKKWYNSNLDYKKYYDKKYRKNNVEFRRVYHILWVNRNKEVYLEYCRRYFEKKRKEDIQYKIACNLRTRLRMAIAHNQKVGSAVRDLGCSIEELKTYLENKFKPGMTWENYGRKKGLRCWEIDHIIPLTAFDLTNREQLLNAVHYTNLQPLWADENYKKGNKRNGK